MTIHQMEYFIEIAKSGSFSKAAEELFVSQQGISKQLSAIEKEIGLCLINRDNKRRVQLTGEGELLYRRWEKLLCEYKESLTDALILAGKLKKKIRIGIYEAGPVIDYVMPLINGYRVNNPDIETECVFGGEDDIMRRLDQGDLEMAFAFCAKYRDYSISCLPIYFDRICVALSKKHHLAGRDHLSVDDIATEKLYVLDNSYSFDACQNIKNLLKRNGYGTQNIVPVKDLNNMEMMLNLAEGITISPHILLRNANQEIVFCPIKEQENEDAISLYAIWKDDGVKEFVMKIVGQSE